MTRPSGTVTFLFSDIEGSTRRWEADSDTMRVALATHDDVLLTVIEAHAGWTFKHTGDGICAAFSSANDAISAAVEAQRRLELPVRMGIATGSVEMRGDDYFGPALNRTARVMSAGHGGQILVAAATAALAAGQSLIDLGMNRLRDLSGAEHLFQVRADGLRLEFPPLRTLDATPGNLPVQNTTLIGRSREVKELVELVRARRLVTLTGVGGVGKTRLGLQVAAELTGEFADGVWLIELAPVVDPGAVGGAVATALGVTTTVGDSVAASVAQALSGRRLLVVLDNCEHVLDESAELVEAILASTSTVHVLATSREGLRVAPEQLWPVPSLDVLAGATSAAAELFVERARTANPAFDHRDAATMAAVAEICSRLDGIALAIVLAAARMVAMSPQDLRDRLGDRFRLLSGARRGQERHQTLRQAVSWSYDLLDENERTLLTCCSVFAGGFDGAAATSVVDGPDVYAVLDGLESLVRKSLLTVDQAGGHARYGMLETIRQFAEEQLAVSGSIEVVRDRHAAFYADQAMTHWARWDGPLHSGTLVWVDTEFANLRAAFQWSTGRNDLVTATAVAAHTTMLAYGLQRYEPVGWAEQLLPAAVDAGVPQLPRLYTAASLCSYTFRPGDGVGYAERAVALEDDVCFDPFENGWARYWQGTAQLFAGHPKVALAIWTDHAAGTGSAHIQGRIGQTLALGLLGRSTEAIPLVDDTISSARAHGNPWLINQALNVAGYAYRRADPVRALDWFHQALTYAVEHGSPFWEAEAAQVAAPIEMLYGDAHRALDLYDRALELFHQCGSVIQAAQTILSLAGTFYALERPDTAAILLGAAARHPTRGDPYTVERLRGTLGDATYQRHFATGAAMDLPEAVRFARDHIEAARREVNTSPSQVAD